MLEKIPVKKSYLLIAATLVLLLLSYRFAFQHTIEAWQIHSQLQTKLTKSTDVSYQPGYLERKSANIDHIINQYKVDTSEFRSNIISTIASIAEKENVKLAEVPIQDASYNTNQFITEKLEFEGDYVSLLKVAHELQVTKNIGMIRSEQWKVITFRTNVAEMKKLILTEYLQIPK